MDTDIMISICQGDITYETSDAIVCPASHFLEFHGGVGSCILRRGGKSILDQTEAILKEKIMIPTGTVVVTDGGRLKSHFIIHAVGPNLNDPSQIGLDRPNLLAFAVRNALKTADEELKCLSLSIPAISTGSFGFPKK
jgi:putative ATPase